MIKITSDITTELQEEHKKSCKPNYPGLKIDIQVPIMGLPHSIMSIELVVQSPIPPVTSPKYGLECSNF